MNWIDWSIVLVSVGIVGGVAIFTQRYMTSVADFCSASRVAGRYVIANARGEMGMAVVGLVAGFEVFYRAGWTMGWWGFISIPVGMVMVLTGFVAYRYRETRVMTMAQFFEIRYSRGFRLLTGFMAFLSGVVNYGIFPAVAARFFVYFCGLPQDLHLGGVAIPTFSVIMALYLSAAMLVTPRRSSNEGLKSAGGSGRIASAGGNRIAWRTAPSTPSNDAAELARNATPIAAKSG